jgi:glycosyltransferase involved in cell wall biosynthesis
MKIAFYAPMNAPDVGAASGDRSLARLFMRALRELGHDVEVTAQTSTYSSTPKDFKLRLVQAHLEAGFIIARDGRASSDRSGINDGAAPTIAISRASKNEADEKKPKKPGITPDLWFTYHVYYRAPDVIGPRVPHVFGIPYLIAEASDAPKHKTTEWADAYRRAHDAIAQADRVFAMTAHDRACLAQFVEPSRLIDLPPFIHAAPFRAWRGRQNEARDRLRSQGIALDGPVLVTVGMMRHRKKLASYQMLADALSMVVGRPWTLLVIGDGPARPDVETAFFKFGPDRVRFAGARAPDEMPIFFTASDIYVWPGVEEAFGLAFLEAQATGLPAIAQDTRGIPSVVERGITGILTPVGDTRVFADAISSLLDDSKRRSQLGAAAMTRIDQRHTLEHAKAILSANIEGLMR